MRRRSAAAATAEAGCLMIRPRCLASNPQCRQLRPWNADSGDQVVGGCRQPQLESRPPRAGGKLLGVRSRRSDGPLWRRGGVSYGSELLVRRTSAPGHEETFATLNQISRKRSPVDRHAARDRLGRATRARPIEPFASPTSMRLSATRPQSYAIRACQLPAPLRACPFL